ncbi:hypothetical protein VPHK567_0268 [Vibrio phage K567]|nr:membrane protein [Vibrio phage 6E35.1a]
MISKIALLLYTLNLAIPIIVITAEVIINFSLRTKLNWSKPVIKYQGMKYNRFGRVVDAADAFISCIWLDVIVGGVVLFATLFLLNFAPWALALIATPFVLRYLTRGKK